MKTKTALNKKSKTEIYNLRIIQYFQPKIGRKITIFSLGRKNNILIKRKSVDKVEEVSIESVAPNLSNNPAVLNVKPDKLRSIKKPTGWNSFLKAVAVSITFELL